MTKREVALILSLVVIAFVGITTIVDIKKEERVQQEQEADRQLRLEKAYGSVYLFADSAYVYDDTAQTVLFAKNETVPKPIASITKIMTAAVALDQLPADSIVTITPKALAMEGDNGLAREEKWNLKDLIAFTLVVSSNDGAEAIAEAVTDKRPETSFLDLMNAKAKRIGLTATEFKSPTGLDLGTDSASVISSAQDVARLFSLVYHSYPDIFSTTTQQTISITSLSGIRHEVANTDKIIDQIPTIRASKTGFTDIAGGTLAILYEAPNGHLIEVVVLDTTKTGRFADILALVSATNTFFQ